MLTNIVVVFEICALILVVFAYEKYQNTEMIMKKREELLKVVYAFGCSEWFDNFFSSEDQSIFVKKVKDGEYDDKTAEVLQKDLEQAQYENWACR